MKTIVTLVTGAFMLIGLYLLVANGDKTVKIIDVIASNSTAGIKTLQGR